MVKQVRPKSLPSRNGYSVLDPRVADLLSEEELQQDMPDQDDQAAAEQSGGRLIGIVRIPVPPHLLR
jgi:hypothetical protein